MSDRRGKPLFIEAPPDLHHAVRVAAAVSGKTLRQWMIEAATAKLAGGCPCEEEPVPAGE
jgi:uncharacterized protein (DUF1778 family)